MHRVVHIHKINNNNNIKESTVERYLHTVVNKHWYDYINKISLIDDVKMYKIIQTHKKKKSNQM